MARGAIRMAAIAMAGASLCACATVRPQYSTTLPHARPPSGKGGSYKVGAPYQVGGIWYVPREQPDYDQVGIASWYGDAFNLKPTADGEIFDKDAPSAAHTTLPLPSLVEVTNLDNGRKLIVRVNDRGPFVGGRIIDLSHEAARELGYDRAGLAHVRVRYVGPAPLYGEDTRRYVKLTTPQPKAQVAAAAPPPTPVLKASASKAAQVVASAAAPIAETPELLVPRPIAPVAAAPLAPLTGAALPDLRPATPPETSTVAAAAPPAASAPPVAAPPPAGFHIQAGVFSTPQNAERAVSELAVAGPARIIPMQRNETTLYRVVVDGAPDEDAAEALREKVAEAGFADARVIGPSS